MIHPNSFSINILTTNLQATLSAFDPDHHELLPQTTIEDVFSSVQSDSVKYGVVPFENSTNGSVVFTLDLFADQHQKYPDIVVCGERYVEVHHCLLGHPVGSSTKSISNGYGNTVTPNNPPKMIQQDTRSPSSSGHATPTLRDSNPANSRARPLTSISHITKIYSHPQAWGQCKAFLSCHLKGVERQDVSSTSKAAELVAADETGTTAAISSGIAAQMHNLGFLARDIEDESDNATRFFIIRKRQPEESRWAQTDRDIVVAGDGENHDSKDGSGPTFKSLLSFTVSHTDAGALADALAVFKRHGLNLSSINPRPSGEAPWHYIFFVELLGSRGQGTMNDALEELGNVVRTWRWLGSWENALGKH